MKIALRKLSTKDLATLCERLIKLSRQEKFKSLLENHPLVNELISAYHSYDQSYSKNTYSGKGETVAEADRKRDELFVGIRSYLQGYLKLKSLPYYAEAEALYSIFKTHGLKLDSLSYSSESAQMKQLLADLAQVENQTRIGKLALTTAYSQLQSAQQAFEQIFAEQAQANAELRQQKSATSLRKDVEEKLRNYLAFINAMQSVNGWQPLYLDINEILKAAAGS